MDSTSFSFIYALFCLFIYIYSPIHLTEFATVGAFMVAMVKFISLFLPDLSVEPSQQLRSRFISSNALTAFFSVQFLPPVLAAIYFGLEAGSVATLPVLLLTYVKG